MVSAPVTTAGKPGHFGFLLGEQHPILPITQRPNFTKFEHNTSIGVKINAVGTEF